MTQTHADIIETKGGPAVVAEALSIKPARVRTWVWRGKIPRSNWPEVIEAFPEITLEALKAAEAA